MLKEKMQYFKDLIDKEKNPQLHLWVGLAASVALICIAVGLTVASIFVQKDLSTITISSYGFLSGMAFLTYNSGEKNKDNTESGEQKPL